MQKTVKIASAQYPISKHNSLEDWRNHIESWVEKAVCQEAGLLLFPEYGSMELVSLFPLEIQTDIEKQLSEMQGLMGVFCDHFTAMAMKYKVIIVAPSFPVAESAKIYNRTFVFGAKGELGYQDKIFMTRFENETWGVHSAPKVFTVFEAAWGNFGIQTCYDIEFALGSKLLCEAGADLILVPSCTETLRGATRVHVGARARALENQCYTIVSQTVGEALWSPAVDINFGYVGIYATPDAGFPESGILHTGNPQDEEWILAELDLEKLKNVRVDGQVLNFKDHQNLAYGFKDDEVSVLRKIVGR